jgi:hypothetical protein
VQILMFQQILIPSLLVQERAAVYSIRSSPFEFVGVLWVEIRSRIPRMQKPQDGGSFAAY